MAKKKLLTKKRLKKKPGSKKRYSVKNTTAKKRAHKKSKFKIIPISKRGPGPQCPECGSEKIGGGACFNRIQENQKKGDPWGHVLRTVKCRNCEGIFPAHIWHLWGDITPAEARKEWRDIFLEYEKTRHKLNKGPGCPECGSRQIGCKSMNFPFKNDDDNDDFNPWRSNIFEIIFCGECKIASPTDAWELPFGTTPKEANQDWVSIYKGRKHLKFENFKTEKTKNVGSGCPECGSTKISKRSNNEPPKENSDFDNPWTHLVSEIIKCGECSCEVPIHIWELWDGVTPDEAHKEWVLEYKGKK